MLRICFYTIPRIETFLTGQGSIRKKELCIITEIYLFRMIWKVWNYKYFDVMRLDFEIKENIYFLRGIWIYER